MRELLSNVGQAALELASYGPRILASFRYPERSRSISLSGPQATLFLLISSVLLTALVAPVKSATPAIVGMARGPVVLLPYQADREVYASTLVTLGPIGVANALLFLVLGIASFAALAWCLGGRKEQSFLEMALQLAAPVCAARVANAAIKLVMLRSATWTELPSPVLLGVAVLFVVMVAYCCWILLRSVKSAANISWPRSIAVFFVGGFLAAFVFQFANPMQLYRIVIAPPQARTAAAEDLVASAEEAYGRSDFDSALESLSESLEIEPNNLFAQTLLMRVYWEQCFAVTGPECLTAAIWRTDPAAPNRRWKATVRYYDDLRQAYRDVPSVLLHVADTYNFIGACDEAESLYHEVLRSNESLPHERFTAASVLASFMLPEAPEDPLVRAWESPETQIDRIALTVRTATASAITIRPDLALSDPVLGVDLRHLFSEAPFKERYMVRWMKESPCAQHRRAKWW
jgi:tetratricopeptide (TPR) repeat protein